MNPNEYNSRIPASPSEIDDLTEGGQVFYIVNTLVHEKDGSRILGPMDEASVRSKKEQYDQIVSNLPENGKAGHPFIVLRLTADSGLENL